MRNKLKYLIPILLLFPLGAFALSTFVVNQGGSGVSNWTQGWVYAPGGTTALTSSTSPTARFFIATSSIASQFPYASTTMVTFTTASTTNLNVSGISNSVLSTLAGVVTGTTISAPLVFSGTTLSCPTCLAPVNNDYDWTFLNTYGGVNLTPTSTMPVLIQGQLNASSSIAVTGVSKPEIFSGAFTIASSTGFGFDPATYKVLQIGTSFSAGNNRSLSLNFDPKGVTGGAFSGAGNILISSSSILAPNAAGTNWMGVLRATVGKVFLGGTISSGELKGDGVVVSGATAMVATSTPTSGVFGAPIFQVEQTGSATTILAHKESADANSAVITMLKRRNGASILSTNDFGGIITWEGMDGTNPLRMAQIDAQVDTTPSAGVMPGRLMFRTTNAAGTLTERARIDSTGHFGIGTTNPGYALDVTGEGHFTTWVDASFFAATTSTATSTFLGSVTIGTTTSPTASSTLGLTVMKTGVRNGGDVIKLPTDTGFPDAGSVISFASAATENFVGLGANAFVTSAGAGSRYDTNTTGWLYLMDNRSAINATRWLYGNAAGAFSTYMTLNNNGNLGIATGTPNNLLDVFSATKAAIGFSGASGPTNKWTIGEDVTNAGRFSIASSTALGTTDRFIIDGTGDVGINETAPQTYIQGFISSSANGLVVGGNTPAVVIRENDVSNSQLSFYQAGGDSFIDSRVGALRFAPNDTELVRMTAGGLMGVGTTTPAAKLEVLGSTGALGVFGLNTSAQILMGRTGTTIGQGYIGADANNALMIFDGSAVKLATMMQGGNFGINVATPAQKFQVNGSLQGGTAFSASATSTWATMVVRAPTSVQNGATGLIFHTDANATTYPNSGAGFAAIDTQASGGGGVADLAFMAASGNVSAERMRIRSTGAVGIGTTTPVGKLTVAGDLSYFGTIPTLSSCGTSPTITVGSTDMAGEVTEGAVSTGCTISFSATKTNQPFCVVDSEAGLVFTHTISTSAITITNVGALSSTKLSYVCVANNK